MKIREHMLWSGVCILTTNIDDPEAAAPETPLFCVIETIANLPNARQRMASAIQGGVKYDPPLITINELLEYI